MKGVCAGGHPLTAEAGRLAFEAGGNAIDAAVAAQLMACVAEPLLTGLGGGGVALIHHEGETRVLDLFSDRPGLGPPRTYAPLDHVEVSFGPDTQRFSYGVASVTAPAMIYGLWTLHQAGGRLPLPTLARWAADRAESGVEVSEGLSKSIGALAAIIEKDDYLRPKFFDSEGGVVPPGHRYDLKEMSETLMRWAEGGPQALLSGPPLKDILDTLGPFAPLGAPDLIHYKPRWSTPLVKTLAGVAQVTTTGLPSQGGVQLLALLTELEELLDAPLNSNTHTRDPLSIDSINLIAEAMRRVEESKGPLWPAPLVDERHPESKLWRSQLGFTTHLSTSDERGSVVGITSSLGETAGVSVGSRGLLLNNFLGETDVAPPHCMPSPGERLFTMCTPTMVEYRGQRYVMGSGGSSRIRSVLLHGIVYLIDELLGLKSDLKTIARAPRCHWEGGQLRIELKGRPASVFAELEETWGDALIPFQDENLYFGGLHMSACGARGLLGAGDPRRSGHYSICR